MKEKLETFLKSALDKIESCFSTLEKELKKADEQETSILN